MPCIVCNVMWMLDDFTSENGATWIVPGSHKLGRRPNKDDLKNQMQVIGPAGNCFIFDGRLIHGSGAYLSQDPTGERKALTYAYQPPMFRPFENYPMALLRERQQLLVGCRAPPSLALLDARSGRTLSVLSGLIKTKTMFFGRTKTPCFVVF